MQYKYTVIFITIFIPNHPNHNYMKNGFTHIPPNPHLSGKYRNILLNSSSFTYYKNEDLIGLIRIDLLSRTTM